MKYASKGVAGSGLGLGIAGTALGLLNGGGLGNILGGDVQQRHHEPMESKESAMLREQVATLKSERYTNDAVIDLYKNQTAEFKERDRLIVANEVRSAVNEEKFNCLSEKVGNLQSTVSLHSAELCDLKSREAVTAERLTTLAINTKERMEAQARDFHNALTFEKTERVHGDDFILANTACNYVANKKVIDASMICPSVVTSRDVNNYYAAGNDDATPQATGGTCCSYPSSNS